MRYFQKFPLVDVETTEVIDGLPQHFIRSVPNMTIRFKVDYTAGDYEWYTITDRDRADTLAAQWYGSSEYTWAVLLSNDMKDLYDWPMDTLQFYRYMSRKYESSVGSLDGVVQSQNTIYQYLWTDTETGQELVVDAAFYADLTNVGARRQVSVYDYENQLNDSRRRIKRLTLPTFQAFVDQFNRAVLQ